MEAYKRGGHTVWDCKYHLVWVTKYRYPVLGGDVGVRCRELLRETARAHEMAIHDIKNQAPPEPDDNFNVT
jgi:putative transposase